jgi:hypothetical protein
MSSPQPEPRPEGGDVTTSSDDTPLVVIEGPGDTTRRPRRPNNPRQACPGAAAGTPTACDGEAAGKPADDGWGMIRPTPNP